MLFSIKFNFVFIWEDSALASQQDAAGSLEVRRKVGVNVEVEIRD